MSDRKLDQLFSLLFQAHPWHGVSPGPDAPSVVTAFIEVVPAEGIKYELDKTSGHLKVDRPLPYSSLCPTLYGFVPQTYCGVEVARRCCEKTGMAGVLGDGDPLDICVLTERTILHGNLLVRARPIGGLRMVDGNEADDKIIAVLEADAAYGAFQDMGDCPSAIVDRIVHYFLSYKQLPGAVPRKVEIAEVYDRTEALEVISRSLRDYATEYGAREGRLEELRKLISEGR